MYINTFLILLINFIFLTFNFLVNGEPSLVVHSLTRKSLKNNSLNLDFKKFNNFNKLNFFNFSNDLSKINLKSINFSNDLNQSKFKVRNLQDDPNINNYIDDVVWAMIPNMGTPNQPVVMAIDLENPDFIVESKSLCDSSCSLDLFDQSISSTYKTLNHNISQIKQFNISENGFDLVSISNMTAVNQSIGLISSVINSSDTAVQTILSGTIGLAYGKDKENICLNMKNNGVISKNMFSMMLIPQFGIDFCKNNASLCDDKIKDGGIFIFGGYDINLLPDNTDPESQIYWIPVIDKNQWIVQFPSDAGIIFLGLINGTLQYSGGKFGNYMVPTLITTTSQVVFSVTLARTLSESHNGWVDPTHGYVGRCGGMIPPCFLFPYGDGVNPKIYSVMDYSYFYTKPIPNDKTTCYAGFSDMNLANTSYWVLGTPFFANLDIHAFKKVFTGLYTIFDRDNDRIGFVRGKVKT
ncbi:aspartic peptidase domain-containing protein [Gigaspora rosea]|uniref:Aspartic peptidase domain-containing protein n=1 Tax=Gigaspora rosea TaxID=44941 RepID=A0A397W8H7_9GLOM|nr:aspartic peptidase domain-containing protein [Gigaspora rosea]